MRVKQILLNLLSNAIKFTPENGTITLRLEQNVEEQEGNIKAKMLFRVQDTGIGMAPDFMDRVFAPFEQQDASTYRKYGGTGLGLSISKQLAELMEGNIHVESEQGVGTTFIVNIPFDIEIQNIEEKNIVDFSKMRALLVEPNEETREYNQSLLRKLKIKIDYVSNGEEAIHKLTIRHGGTYDYALCMIVEKTVTNSKLLDENVTQEMGKEIQQAELDVIKLVKQIKGMKDSKTLIIVLIQAGTSKIVDQVREEGADIVVEKPLFQSVLFDFLMEKCAGQMKKNISSVQMANFNGLHVLLVEDNEMNMEIAEDILTRVNLKVDKAVNGKDAYDQFLKIPKGTYQAILMDVQMPVMDGYEATRAIRQSNHPDAKNIPIIALTANAFTEDVQQAMEAGMNGHIAKPINTKELFDLLGKLL